MDQLIAGRYRIIRVMPGKNGIAYYCVSDRETGQICLMSAVSERVPIRRCLKELTALPQGPGYLGCFLWENTLYVKTAWLPGKTLRSVLSKKCQGYRERLLLVRSIITQALSLDSLPNVLRDSLFDPDYILTEGDTIFFQVKLQTERAEENPGGVPLGSRELLMEVFSAREQSEHKGLYLALEKLKREVTASTGELLHDVDQMIAQEDKRAARLDGWKEKGKHGLALFGKAAACTAAAGILASLLSCGGGKKGTAVYQDITAIGSVQLTDGGGEP